MSRFDQAEKELDDIIRLEPKNEMARDRRSTVAGHTKHWNKVIEDSTYVIKSKPMNLSSCETLANRAAAYVNLKQYDRAITDYKDGLKIVPDGRQLHVGLINAYTLSGKTQAAQAERKILSNFDADFQPMK
jgi:tetratricopeptide (TPR) repeat protein